MRRVSLLLFAVLSSAPIACAKKKPVVEPRPVLASLPGRSIPALAAADRAYAAGDLATAEHWYGKAIETEPTSADAHYLRSRTRLDRGDVAGAEKDVSIALAISPAHWESVSLRGVLLERQGKREEARIAFRDARNLAPNALAPRNNLAFLALLEGRNEEAYDLLNALSREFPASARIWTNLSVAADRLGREAEAKNARAQAARTNGVTE